MRLTSHILSIQADSNLDI